VHLGSTLCYHHNVVKSCLSEGHKGFLQYPLVAKTMTSGFFTSIGFGSLGANRWVGIWAHIVRTTLVGKRLR
jgi:hypothetical protein